MPHHWYAIANAERERMHALHQVNSTRRDIIQIVEDFHQLVKQCDDATHACV